jgi:hypothetical protein
MIPVFFGIASRHVLFAILSFLSIFMLSPLIAFIAVRWGFAPCATAMARVSPGISKSWRLTRGSFWRTFGVLLVVLLIAGIVIGMFSMVFAFQGIVKAILVALLTLVGYIIFFVAMAVLYFDLEIRYNAGDLRAMVDELNTFSGANTGYNDVSKSPIR